METAIERAQMAGEHAFMQQALIEIAVIAQSDLRSHSKENVKKILELAKDGSNSEGCIITDHPVDLTKKK